MLQRTATHCSRTDPDVLCLTLRVASSTLKCTATHCNTLQHSAMELIRMFWVCLCVWQRVGTSWMIHVAPNDSCCTAVFVVAVAVGICGVPWLTVWQRVGTSRMSYVAAQYFQLHLSCHTHMYESCQVCVSMCVVPSLTVWQGVGTPWMSYVAPSLYLPYTCSCSRYLWVMLHRMIHVAPQTAVQHESFGAT